MIDQDDKEFQEKIEALLRRARNATGAANIIAFLFPKAERVLKTYVPSDHADRWEQKRARRISQAEFASTYFGLDPSPLIWSREEIDELIRSEHPLDALGKARRRIEMAPASERSRLRAMLLDALNGVFEGRRLFNQAWLDALIDESAYFLINADQEPTMFGVDNSQRLRWILRSAFNKMDVSERSAMVLAEIQKARDLTLICDFVRTYTPDWHPRGAVKRNDGDSFFGAHDHELRAALLDRVEQVAASNQFWLQADPSRLLWFWWSCDKEEDVKKFTADAMRELASLRGLLSAPIGLIRSTGGNYESVAPYWSSIVDLEALAAQATAIKESGGGEEDFNIAERFLVALKRGREHQT